jgi:predicted glutamine amidotransferase
MCKMLGISFKEDAKRYMTQYYLRHFFAKFGPIQPHGWGFCFYDTADRPVLFKEPYPAQTSAALRHLLDSHAIHSDYVIAHVRYRSLGPIMHHLTQPFTDNTYAFGHNGTLFGLSDHVDLNATSDSLYLFEELQKVPRSPKNIFAYLREMNAYGSMSVVLSDGKYLLGYRDAQGSVPLYYRRFKGGYVICSLPIISKKQWKPVPPNSSVLFVKGELSDLLY